MAGKVLLNNTSSSQGVRGEGVNINLKKKKKKKKKPEQV